MNNKDCADEFNTKIFIWVGPVYNGDLDCPEFVNGIWSDQKTVGVMSCCSLLSRSCSFLWVIYKIEFLSNPESHIDTINLI